MSLAGARSGTIPELGFEGCPNQKQTMYSTKQLILQEIERVQRTSLITDFEGCPEQHHDIGHHSPTPPEPPSNHFADVFHIERQLQIRA